MKTVRLVRGSLRLHGLASAAWIFAAFFAGAACSNAPETGDAAPDIAETDTEITQWEPWPDGPGTSDDTVESDIAGEERLNCPGGPGCPCTSNDKCDNALCVKTSAGKFCARTCVDACPSDQVCELVAFGGADKTNICLDRWDRSCDPCKKDNDCNGLTNNKAACVTFGNNGSFCAVPCHNAKCPKGYSCKSVTSIGGNTASRCIPTAPSGAAFGVCTCSQSAATEQLTTTCIKEQTNKAGQKTTCKGERKCTTTGLSACDAGDPGQETCDGIDNDCDGDFDEGACDDGNACTNDLCNPVTKSCSHKLIQGNCDDGNACTASDTCDAQGFCSGKAVSCDDANPCTDDACSIKTGCTHTPNTKPCNADDNSCTSDKCKQGKCEVGLLKTCATSDACTVGQCSAVSGGCTFKAKTDGVHCDDGDACTVSDACKKGACAGSPKPCADSDPCTADACSIKSGKCTHEPIQGPCDDGDKCTSQDSCATGKCVGIQVSCDDGKQCTKDHCVPTFGCSYQLLNGVSCDDGNDCTSADHCKSGACIGGKDVCGCHSDADCASDKCASKYVCDKAAVPYTCTAAKGHAKKCSDADPCTVDACDGKTGACSHAPAPTGSSCNDGDKCTLDERCKGGKCVGTAKQCDDKNPCTKDHCATATGACHNLPLGAGSACDDNDACTHSTTCTAGKCGGGKGIPTDDGNPCTKDSCTPLGGVVHKVMIGAACNDGAACTLNDRCHASGACKGTTKTCNDGDPCTTDICEQLSGKCVASKVTCDDGNVCTTDVCSGPLGQCKHAAKPGGCADGAKCTTSVCKGGKCVSSSLNVDDGNPCTTDSCDPATGKVVHAPSDSPCNDGDPCTAADRCNKGTCVGKAVVCDDKNPCTVDKCDPLQGKCSHVHSTAPCDDGDKCSIGDRCNDGKCKPTSKVSCNDGNLCTDDACNSKTGACLFTANTKPCSDGDACTKNDRCSKKSCKPGPMLSCNDGIQCTQDKCIKATGKCAHIALTGNKCDHGKPCGAGGRCHAGQCKQVKKPEICTNKWDDDCDGDVDSADSQCPTTKVFSYGSRTRTYMPPKSNPHGDADYGGNGPSVTVIATVYFTKSYVHLRVYMRARETKQDWTEASGTHVFELQAAPSKCVITGIKLGGPHNQAKLTYTDNNHAPDTFKFSSASAIDTMTVVGDTNGPDAGVRTKVTVRVKPFKIIASCL